MDISNNPAQCPAAGSMACTFWNNRGLYSILAARAEPAR